MNVFALREAIVGDHAWFTRSFTRIVWTFLDRDDGEERFRPLIQLNPSFVPERSVQELLPEPRLRLSRRRGVAVSEAAEGESHGQLGGELHRLLCIRCAELDFTIQDHVVQLLAGELRGGFRSKVPICQAKRTCGENEGGSQ